MIIFSLQAQLGYRIASYGLWTAPSARRTMSVEILSTAAQLYEKSHLKRHAIRMIHSKKSELSVLDRPYVTYSQWPAVTNNVYYLAPFRRYMTACLRSSQPSSWKIEKLWYLGRGQKGRTAISCQILSKSLTPRPRYGDFSKATGTENQITCTHVIQWVIKAYVNGLLIYNVPHLLHLSVYKWRFSVNRKWSRTAAQLLGRNTWQHSSEMWITCTVAIRFVSQLNLICLLICNVPHALSPNVYRKSVHIGSKCWGNAAESLHLHICM